uniref:Class I SAM-dependent methyltransferase n=1 Tax=Roseihalotalea indica TaxID=2867963 RepID=A0AA49GS08_9BACT|nr:class I SAM-dependent methyltransferase [Tunicatimonas sp. TK19036]
MDKLNGYESIAPAFIERRGKAVSGIGMLSVQNWAQKLSYGSSVLDLGCGTGIPISKVLVEAGMKVYGIDASPTMIGAFRQNFPNIPMACESVEESAFFNLPFDAIIAWGLMFLLPEDVQTLVIQKVGRSLLTGGKFLFTAPYQKIEWKDSMTGQSSRSLGREKYQELLSSSGLSLIEEFEDEGENHYFNTVKG